MEPISLTDLRADAGAIIYDGSSLHGKTYIDPDDLLALLDIAEAARQLLNELDDAIASADLETWNAPYRIEAPTFRNGSDRLREALAPFT